jgi:ABC-2 type transport system permease protein
VLLRPIHPIHRDIAENLSYKLLTLSVMLPVAVGLGFYFQVDLRPAPWAIVAFVPALVLAFALRFMIEWALAMAAFWTTRVSALNSLYYLVSLFLSGQMAPLSLLPPPIQTLATVLPFRWTVAFPVEVLLGRLTMRETLLGFVAQAVWLLLSLGLMTAVWRAGVRRYSAVGA